MIEERHLKNKNEVEEFTFITTIPRASFGGVLPMLSIASIQLQ